MQGQRSALVDVRSPGEFTGEILAPPGLPETCQRGGHIPGARSIPWGKACNEDGTFKSFDELKALYGSEGVDGSKPIIAYCRIGERSSHTWFVLSYLLGYDHVRNYDGSWTEVGQPGGRAGGAWRGAYRQGLEAHESRRAPRTEHRDRGLARTILTSYRIGETFHCTLDNVSPGATLARTTGSTREEAESKAIERAAERLGRTTRHPV